MGSSSRSGWFQVTVRVNPGTSRRNCVWKDDFLKVNLTSPPEGGRANEELINYIAEVFELKPSEVQLTSGETSRQKELTLSNLTREALTDTIQSLSTDA